MAMTNDEIMANNMIKAEILAKMKEMNKALTDEEIMSMAKNTALSDEETMKASGGQGSGETSPKFRVGDRVRRPNAPAAGIATITRIEKDEYFSELGWKYVVEPDNAPGTEGWVYDFLIVLA